MHLVMFDIDGTLTETMKVDEECFVRSFKDIFDFAARLQATGNDTFQYSSAKYTWKFSCDSRRGFCRYSLR